MITSTGLFTTLGALAPRSGAPASRQVDDFVALLQAELTKSGNIANGVPDSIKPKPIGALAPGSTKPTSYGLSAGEASLGLSLNKDMSSSAVVEENAFSVVEDEPISPDRPTTAATGGQGSTDPLTEPLTDPLTEPLIVPATGATKGQGWTAALIEL